MMTIKNMDVPNNCGSCPFKELKIINDDEARYVMYKCLAADGVWICHDDLSKKHPELDLTTPCDDWRKLPCRRCGGALSEVRYHDGKPYRHCFACHFEFYLEGGEE